MTRPVEYLRADAARNVQRIVEVAAHRLGEDPSVGMAEVALAAGVSRATVYRHFPTREALVLAIHAQALEHMQRAITGSRLDEDTATEALRRLVVAVFDVAERYAFPALVRQPELDASHTRDRKLLGEPLLALIERGRAAGEFSTEQAPSWTAHVFGALLLAAVRAVGDGTLSREAAPDAVCETLLGGARA